MRASPPGYIPSCFEEERLDQVLQPYYSSSEVEAEEEDEDEEARFTGIPDHHPVPPLRPERGGGRGYMERLGLSSGGDRKARFRKGSGDQMGVVRENDGSGDGGGGKGFKFRKQFVEKRRRSSHSGSGGGGFDGGSQMEYEMWKLRTTRESGTASDGRTFTVNPDDNDDDDNDDDHDDQRRRRRLSTGDRQQTTFSDNSIDRRWRFESSGQTKPQPSSSDTAGRWRVSFEGDEVTTNIDDLIQGMDQDERWSFGEQRQAGQGIRDVSSVDAWTPSKTDSEPSTGTLEGTGEPHANAADGQLFFWEFGPVPQHDKTANVDAGDTQSVDTFSTDTDSVFRRDERESLRAKKRQFLMEMALRGKGHAIERLTSGLLTSRSEREHIRTNSWQPTEIPLSPLHSSSSPPPLADKEIHNRLLEDSSAEGVTKEHKRTSSGKHRTLHDHNHDHDAAHGQRMHNTLPTESRRECQRVASWHYRDSFQDHDGERPHPFHSHKDPSKKAQDGAGNGWKLEKAASEDARTEQQKRLDAWVSSIQTHWDSAGSSFEFPFSFEDSFRALDGESDIFYDFPVSTGVYD